MNTFIHSSPVGPLTLVSNGKALVGCYFSNSRHASSSQLAHSHTDRANDPILDATRRELDRYFALELKQFTVPLELRGTEFQRSVWRALQAIPYGETVCYGDIARRLGNSRAVRAVGAANGQNPICVIVPCHRVIGANGSLTGFGGGLARKEYLLNLEQASAEPQSPIAGTPFTSRATGSIAFSL